MYTLKVKSTHIKLYVVSGCYVCMRVHLNKNCCVPFSISINKQ